MPRAAVIVAAVDVLEKIRGGYRCLGRIDFDDDVSELAWFPRDALPTDDELAFTWIGPALRRWAAGREE